MAVLTARKASAGFTMIEMVIVMVIMAIVASMGSQFIVSSAEMYKNNSEKAKLVNRGRQAIERISRQLRLALPNSVRVSSTGRCMEFLPIVGASTYVDKVADTLNGAPATASVTTAPFDLGYGTASYAAIGAKDAGEIYRSTPPSLVGIGSMATSAITSVTFNAAKIFNQNSLVNRIFITDGPTKFCVTNSNELRVYTSYSLPSNGLTGLNDNKPNSGVLMAENVVVDTETPFVLSPGIETRNAVIFIQLPFVEGSNRILLDHKVLIKNVP